jgi:transcriptional regulator with XRE-family HTH domain
MVPMFGDEHLGRAVALRREFRGQDQAELARAIGVHKSTMSGYEKGTRGMDEAALEKISTALGCESIEIWNDAFNIFRFNHFRVRAESVGVPIEELMARVQQRPSVEQIHTMFQAMVDDLWKLLGSVLAFLHADREAPNRTRVPAWGVVVTSKSKKLRALQFQRGKPKPAKGKDS